MTRRRSLATMSLSGRLEDVLSSVRRPFDDFLEEETGKGELPCTEGETVLWCVGVTLVRGLEGL